MWSVLYNRIVDTLSVKHFDASCILMTTEQDCWLTPMQKVANNWSVQENVSLFVCFPLILTHCQEHHIKHQGDHKVL